MNRAKRLEAIIVEFVGNSVSLGTILYVAENKKDFGLRHRLTAATSELRADLHSRTPMMTLVWTKGKTPSLGVYSIVPAEMRDGVVVAKPKQSGVAA